MGRTSYKLLGKTKSRQVGAHTNADIAELYNLTWTNKIPRSGVASWLEIIPQ